MSWRLVPLSRLCANLPKNESIIPCLWCRPNTISEAFISLTVCRIPDATFVLKRHRVFIGTSTAAAIRVACSRFFLRCASLACFLASSYSTSTVTPSSSFFDFGSRIMRAMFTSGSTVSGFAMAISMRSSSFRRFCNPSPLSSAKAMVRAACSVTTELMMQENKIMMTTPFSIPSFMRNTPGAISIWVPTITIAKAPAAWALLNPNNI